MKRILGSLLVLGNAAFAASYGVAPAPDTKMELRVDKTGLYRGKTHIFHFDSYRGALEFDQDRPEESRIDLTIDSASIVCKDDWVSASDRVKILDTALNDMLAAKQYPTMKFTSGSIRALGGNQFVVQGTLTIRDRPKPVTVQVQLDSSGPTGLRVAGSARIHLKDYALKPPSALLGAIGTKEEMALAFEIQANLAR